MVAFSYSSLLQLKRTQFLDPPKPEPVTNFYEEDGEKDGQVIIEPLAMSEVIRRIRVHTGDWPRRVGNILFVHDDSGVHWLDNAAALFGWLQTVCGVIEWRKSVGCVSKDEVYHELCRTCKAYVSVENLPHFPPMPGHYYACKEYPPGDGEAISKLVQFFAPATPQDQDLILGMFVTPFWGGKAGSRPAFLVTSDAGRGIGKSKITDMLSNLLGGHIELSTSEDAGRMRSRLLSPEGMKLRLARLDNVKTLKFSWAELESIITSPRISGHVLHKGEGARPNTLAWLITLNGAALSTDIAQRVIIIKLGKPHRVGAWESIVTDFIEKNADAIISDIRAFLEMDPEPIPAHTRWAAWEDAILGRLHNPEETQKLIRLRSEVADVGREEVQLIESFFADQLEDLGYLPESIVFIPSKIAGEWYARATNERISTVAAGRIISQFCSEEATKKIIPYRKTSGRGYKFSALGDFWDNDDEEKIYFDLRKRIEEKNKSKDSR
jgi:hypothetical protein